MVAKTEQAKLPELVDMDSLCKAADCLRVLAHPARLRMVEILMHGRFPVNHVARMCDLPAHQACEHLRLMQSHGLLSASRDGRTVYYSIASPNLPDIIRCIRRHCGGTSSTNNRSAK
jgi:ArsR family transcriptional regulator, zinc-responsive transcriptional repressor